MSEQLELMRRLIGRWQRRDVEGFLACVTDDIQYHYDMNAEPISGKDAMRVFLERFLKRFEQKFWRIDHHAENDSMLMLEGYEELEDLKHKRVIKHPFMQACEFRGGLICRMRDYYDRSQLLDSSRHNASQ